jgi:hypothetical protein
MLGMDVRTVLAGRVIAGLGAVLVGVAASGCTINIGTGSAPAAARVAQADLERDISDRVTKAGSTPQSVSCPGDLLGAVGTSIRCAVTMGGTGSFETLVTVTSVEGSTVDYSVIPAVSKAQLQTAVGEQVAQSSRSSVDSVVCESGLDGVVGAVAHCAVTAAGATLRRTVVVTAVSGFSVSYRVVPILSRQVAAASLAAQLGQSGKHPDSVGCADDVDGIVGNTVQCTAVTGGHFQTYVLTVTVVSGSNITYRYALKP